MKNIQLNPGGIIGVIVLLVGAVVVAEVSTNSPEQFGGRLGGIGVVAVFIGAFGGNFLWRCLFAKDD